MSVLKTTVVADHVLCGIVFRKKSNPAVEATEITQKANI